MHGISHRVDIRLAFPGFYTIDSPVSATHDRVDTELVLVIPFDGLLELIDVTTSDNLTR